MIRLTTDQLRQIAVTAQQEEKAAQTYLTNVNTALQERVQQVPNDNIFYNKDFGDLTIIGDANLIENKTDGGLLDDEYYED